MKKVLVFLLILAIISLLGVVYVAGKDYFDVVGQKIFVQGPAPQPQLIVGQLKEIETREDTLDAIAYAHTQNADTVGWLRVPDTEISNSVLQSYNNVYYLRLNELGQEDIYGCYFADYEASFGDRQTMSQNTIIYGHSDLQDNPEGPRFSQLFHFTDPEFAQNTPYIYFSTLEEEMVWQVFAVSYADVGFDYIRPNLTGNEVVTLANEAKARSIYNYDVEVGPQDKILTLSTCTVKFGQRNDIRFLIMAKLVPAEEKLVSQAAFTINPDPQQPNL